jgi:adenine-specific DNA-methyltransferase
LTELTWDGKYKDSKKIGPIRIELPFQTVETVNETAKERQLTLDRLFSGQETEWRNRLIWGDKKYVLPSLLPEYAGQVNLIYIDPPFATGADFSFTTIIPESDESFTKEPSMIEQKAYRDTWGKGLDGYLQWFYETVVLLHELLAENGTIYVHCNQDMSPFIRVILDEVFGSGNHLNDVIWHFENKPKFSFSKVFPRDWEIILVYAKSVGNHCFHHAFVPVKEVQQQAIVAWDPVAKKRVAKRDEEGNIVYETRTEKLMGAVWVLPIIHPIAHERLNYPTQKPEALLERIIRASSNEGDLVLDCFCGSGTTAAVAEKLERKWIVCDLGRFAIHTTRKRLLSIDNVKPFVVQNLGKYERQAWQAAEFSDSTQRANVQLRYRNFILQLYRATPIDGYSWLHGIKGGRLVHVGSVDAPIALGEVKAIVNEFWRIRGKDVGEHSNGIDILGWDFAFDLND